MTREETVRNLLTELIDMIDNGSQRDLNRADEIGDSIIKLLEQEPCDCISRAEALKGLALANNKDEIYRMIRELPFAKPKTDFEHKAEIVISQLRADRDRLQDAIEKIKSEIKEWYWQADKQALAKDPCVVDAMVDLFIRTINKYTAESEDKE